MAWYGKGSWRGERSEKGKGEGKSKGKGKGKKEKGEKGEKGDGKSRWRKEEWEDRSQLSSEAADFIPSGLYDYDILSHQYWEATSEAMWREFADHEGTKYYYNCKTGLTQWERPAELDMPKHPKPPPPTDGPKGPKGEGRKGEGKDRKAKGEKGEKGEGKGKREKKERPKEKGETTFGPQGCNLFVFHLPDEWGDEDMVEYFSPHGKIVSAKVMKELGTGRSRGFGFVSYEAQADAATAIRKMQGYKILGKRLKVEFKKGEGEEEPKEKTPNADDERLIGYLRAISAQSVVQSLKDSKDKEVQEEGESPS